MHTITTAVARCTGSVLGLVLERAFARLDKRTLAHLDALDDYLLRDIGLTRADLANFRGTSPVPCAIRKFNALED
jgi:Domain of unknown function (DUF1127)